MYLTYQANPQIKKHSSITDIHSWKIPAFNEGDVVSLISKKTIATIITVNKCSCTTECVCSVSYVAVDREGNEHIIAHTMDANLIHPDFIHLYQ